jgi:signal transduction histidine kinase
LEEDLSSSGQHAGIPELFENAPDALVVADRSGRVELANRRARRWFVPGDEVSDQLPWRIVSAFVTDDRPAHRDTLVNPDGSRTRVEIRIAPVADGRVQLAIRDVTFEEQVEQRATALQRAETIGVLAAGLAHNVNNMLASVVAHLDVALLKISGHDQPEVESALDAAGQGIEAVSGVVRKLLEVARPEPPELERVDLATLLDQQLELVRPSLGTKIVLTPYLTPGLPALVDRSVLASIVVNLLVNARDAMPEGGTATVRLERAGTDTATLTVQDTGYGIEPDQLERIFEPFFSTKRTGSGLGLTTVRSGIAAMGWDVQVTSAPGRGTAFRVTIPLSQRGGSEPHPDRRSRGPSGDSALSMATSRS